jgi:hypothetical protein
MSKERDDAPAPTPDPDLDSEREFDRHPQLVRQAALSAPDVERLLRMVVSGPVIGALTQTFEAFPLEQGLRRLFRHVNTVFFYSREYAVDPLEILFVREVLRTNIVALRATITLQELSQSLTTDHNRRRQRLYLVVEPENHLIGVVTDNDLQNLLQELQAESNGRQLAELIKPNPVIHSPFGRTSEDGGISQGGDGVNPTTGCEPSYSSPP